MKCKVNYYEKVERDNSLPYYLIRATGTQGDAGAGVSLNDGTNDMVLNFAAMQSRVFNFTKCLFPGTLEQCNALEKLFQVDADGNVMNDVYLYLMSYSWETGKKFYIKDANGDYLTEETETEREVVAKSDGIVNGKPVKRGQRYTELVTETIPRVFTRIILTLFEDPNTGKCAENNGEAPEAIAKRNFEQGLRLGRYEIVSD